MHLRAFNNGVAIALASSLDDAIALHGQHCSDSAGRDRQWREMRSTDRIIAGDGDDFEVVTIKELTEALEATGIGSLVFSIERMEKRG